MSRLQSGADAPPSTRSGSSGTPRTRGPDDRQAARRAARNAGAAATCRLARRDRRRGYRADAGTRSRPVRGTPRLRTPTESRSAAALRSVRRPRPASDPSSGTRTPALARSPDGCPRPGRPHRPSTARRHRADRPRSRSHAPESRQSTRARSSTRAATTPPRPPRSHAKRPARCPCYRQYTNRTRAWITRSCTCAVTPVHAPRPHVTGPSPHAPTRTSARRHRPVPPRPNRTTRACPCKGG